jgi:hypothetical protein
MVHVYFNKAQMKGLDSAKKTVALGLEQLKIIRKTLDLGILPEGVFDPTIVRRLHTPSPTRVVGSQCFVRC